MFNEKMQYIYIKCHSSNNSRDSSSSSNIGGSSNTSKSGSNSSKSETHVVYLYFNKHSMLYMCKSANNTEL